MRDRILNTIKPLLEESESELDSLKVLQLVMTLDEAGFTIPVERIATIRTVEDVISLAETHSA